MPDIERLYTAKARATSPDGTVTAVMAIDGVDVELAAMLRMPHKLGEIQNAHYVATKYGQEAGGFHNGRGDALKHALMSAMLTRDVGEVNAGRTLSVDNRTGRIEYTDGVPPQD